MYRHVPTCYHVVDIFSDRVINLQINSKLVTSFILVTAIVLKAIFDTVFFNLSNRSVSRWTDRLVGNTSLGLYYT